MGNKKNKKTPHNSRGKYHRKVKPNSAFTSNESIEAIEGKHIIDLKELASFVADVSLHSNQCTSGTVNLTGEVHRDCLASILGAKCDTCHHQIWFSTCSKVGGIGSRYRWEANVAGVGAGDYWWWTCMTCMSGRNNGCAWCAKESICNRWTSNWTHPVAVIEWIYEGSSRRREKLSSG